MSLEDMVETIMPINMKWVDDFRQYYEGVLDECDGYLENLVTLTTKNINRCTDIVDCHATKKSSPNS